MSSNSIDKTTIATQATFITPPSTCISRFPTSILGSTAVVALGLEATLNPSVFQCLCAFCASSMLLMKSTAASDSPSTTQSVAAEGFKCGLSCTCHVDQYHLRCNTYWLRVAKISTSAHLQVDLANRQSHPRFLDLRKHAPLDR